MTERATPFHCPYCGDEDLRPHAAPPPAGHRNAWLCGACRRVFAVTFVGLALAEVSG
jgi:transposase-like protein